MNPLSPTTLPVTRYTHSQSIDYITTFRNISFHESSQFCQQIIPIFKKNEIEIFLLNSSFSLRSSKQVGSCSCSCIATQSNTIWLSDKWLSGKRRQQQQAHPLLLDVTGQLLTLLLLQPSQISYHVCCTYILRVREKHFIQCYLLETQKSKLRKYAYIIHFSGILVLHVRSAAGDLDTRDSKWRKEISQVNQQQWHPRTKVRKKKKNPQKVFWGLETWGNSSSSGRSIVEPPPSYSRDSETLPPSPSVVRALNQSYYNSTRKNELFFGLEIRSWTDFPLLTLLQIHVKLR